MADSRPLQFWELMHRLESPYWQVAKVSGKEQYIFVLVLIWRTDW